MSATGPVTIAGYSEFEVLARGGFSTVYVASRVDLGQRVAVKVLDIKVTDERGLEKFRRECVHTGLLTNHPNAVTALDSGVTGEGHPYLTTPFHSEGSLAARVEQDGPLPVDEVLAVGVKMCGALATAHGEGVRHCDVKPENILVSEYGDDPLLADFGISRLTATPEFSGTAREFSPLHVAPEVLEATSITDAVDVYSLGSTLYTLLEGHAPYATVGDESYHSLLVRKLRNERFPFTDRTPRVVQPVLRDAMAYDPDRRPSVTALADRLADCQRTLGLTPTPLPVLRAGRRRGAAAEDTVTRSPWARPPEAGAPADDPAATVVTRGRAPSPPSGPQPTGPPPPPAVDPGAAEAERQAPVEPTPGTPPVAGEPGPADGAPPERFGRKVAAVVAVVVLAFAGLGVANALLGGPGDESADADADAASPTTAPGADGATPTTVTPAAAGATGELPAVPDPPEGLADCPEPPSAQVSVAGADFDPADPPLPTDLSLAVLGDDQLAIGWNDASNGTATHLVAVRCLADDGSEVQLRFHEAGDSPTLDLQGLDTTVSPCVAVGLIARFAEGTAQLWPEDPWECAP
ncbi:MAG: protein kinase [Microthrixaceae bacterium]|nr:protein kinase [Microthrixaceae bacterium]